MNQKSLKDCLDRCRIDPSLGALATRLIEEAFNVYILEIKIAMDRHRGLLPKEKTLHTLDVHKGVFKRRLDELRLAYPEAADALRRVAARDIARCYS